MSQELPGGEPQICACPGCDEVVVQTDPGYKRLYHSAECRRKARRLRHKDREADTADQPTVAAASGRLGTDLPSGTELAADEHAPSAELVPAELPRGEELPGSGAEQDVVTTPEEDDDAEGPGDSEFWMPGSGEADGFWDVGDDSLHKGIRSAGRHRSAPSQRSRLKRSHTVAIAITLAASAVGLGLVFSQPSGRHPLASGIQLHPPGVGATQPTSSSSSPPAGHARTHRAARHSTSGTSFPPGPPATSPSSPPSTGSPAPSPRPSPKPSRRSSPPSPKPSRSPKKTSRVPAGLISFENGADGWKTMYALHGSIRSAQSAWVSYSGSHSLRITLRGSDGAVGVSNSSISHLQPGDTVTYHIYSDGQSGGRVGVFAQTWNQPEDVAEVVPLPTHRGWFTVTWTVPSVSRVNVIGVQVAHNGGGKLTLAIDALNWTGS